MSDAPVLIPLDQLCAHPDNPRLILRGDVVDAIAAGIAADGFAPRYAITARAHEGAYQILAGHHRTAAAQQAGLTSIPCWIVEMDDDRAFMELVLSNTHGELSGLERGIHALKVVQKAKAGRGEKEGLRKYAKDVGKDHALIVREIKAAEVWKIGDPGHQFSPDNIPQAKNLAELHVAASWLWPALVSRLIKEGWNVDTARQQAGRLKDVPEPPSWADGERIARSIAAGTFKPGDVARMAKTAQEASAIIERVELDATDYQQELQDRLEADRPATVSAVQAIADRVVSAQAEAKRQHEETERAKRRARQADRERAEQRVALLRKAVTVKQWNDLDPETKEMLLNLDPTTVPRRAFNDEKSMDVEWAMKTHNPLTGCRHDCPYCYARDIAERFRTELPELYPEGFEPTRTSAPPSWFGPTGASWA
jgi:ParB-like chromosome segregation protein Spo0J